VLAVDSTGDRVHTDRERRAASQVPRPLDRESPLSSALPRVLGGSPLTSILTVPRAPSSPSCVRANVPRHIPTPPISAEQGPQPRLPPLDLPTGRWGLGTVCQGLPCRLPPQPSGTGRRVDRQHLGGRLKRLAMPKVAGLRARVGGPCRIRGCGQGGTISMAGVRLDARQPRHDQVAYGARAWRPLGGGKRASCGRGESGRPRTSQHVTPPAAECVGHAAVIEKSWGNVQRNMTDRLLPVTPTRYPLAITVRQSRPWDRRSECG
jgi:hypothetical protein